MYDVVLYNILKEGNPGGAQQFYAAVMSCDEATKGQFQDQYWQYTKEKLQDHVNGLLSGEYASLILLWSSFAFNMVDGSSP